MVFKKILGVLMAVVLVFSLSVPAYAVTPGDDMIGQIDLTPEEIAKANAEVKTIFENLTPSQQAVFLANIEALAYNGDTRLIEFHKAYVDPTYEFDPSNSVSQPMATAAADIGAQLQALNLPSAVYYGLMALAAALGVPVGNVVDLVISLGLAAIIIANWDAISGVWQDIIDIFVDAFGSFVLEAFYYLQGLVGVYTVTVSGTTITVNNDKYRCTEEAETVVLSMQSSNHSYYPAVRSGDYILVAPTSIPKKVAIAILKKNSDTAGVFALNYSLAYSLCNGLGGARGPEQHGSGAGYWPHFHPNNYPDAHCWYIG